VEEELKSLAREASDLKSWQQQAVKVKGVAGNPDLLSEILSGKLYEKLRGGKV